MRLGAVLLASGAGRRFGGNKLLAEVEGVPLIRRAMAAVPARLFDRAAVCSPYPEVLALAGASGYLPLRNSHADEGVSASVRLGLSAMEGMDGVLFSVCDQPFLTTNSIKALINSFLSCPDRICALSWQGKRGNPVVFPADLFPELSVLTGDVGGGAVIKAHPQRLLLVEAGSADELRDVDTRSDL